MVLRFPEKSCSRFFLEIRQRVPPIAGFFFSREIQDARLPRSPVFLFSGQYRIYVHRKISGFRLGFEKLRFLKNVGKSVFRKIGKSDLQQIKIKPNKILDTKIHTIFYFATLSILTATPSECGV